MKIVRYCTEENYQYWLKEQKFKPKKMKEDLWKLSLYTPGNFPKIVHLNTVKFRKITFNIDEKITIVTNKNFIRTQKGK